jgi:hypothetical protein
MPGDSGGAISDDELSQLADLFLHFEGASMPLSVSCKEAEQRFDKEVERLFKEQVEPSFKSLSLTKFRSMIRNRCRQRLAKQTKYPCT